MQAPGPDLRRGTATFTGPERTRALGVWAAVGGSGAAIGVIAGGILTSAAGWAWVFFINAPIGIVVLLTLPRLLPAVPAATGDRRSADLAGALLATAATGAALDGLITAGTSGWLSASALVPPRRRRGPVPALTVAAAGAALAAMRHHPAVLITGLALTALGSGATLVTAITTALADAHPAEAGVRFG